MKAVYANPEHTDVFLDLEDGSGMALKPGHEMLEGLDIAPFPVDPKRAIMEAWQTRLDLGLPLSDGRAVALDAASREVLSSSAAMAQLGGLPDDFAWRLVDNSYLPLDGAKMIAMALAAGQRYYALFAVRSAKLDAAARGEVVDFETGWPEPVPFNIG